MHTKSLVSLLTLSTLAFAGGCGGGGGASIDGVCNQVCDCVVAAGFITPAEKAGCVTDCKADPDTMAASQACLDCTAGSTCMQILGGSTCQTECNRAGQIDGGPTPDGGGGPPDATASADAPVVPSIPATNLGKPCTMAMPCPNAAGGEICALIETGATTGICTIPCPTVSEEGPCGAGNGFPGPGVGYCAFTSGADPNMHFCGIGCGEQNGGNVMCPTGDTCKDLINMNGMGDLCAP